MDHARGMKRFEPVRDARGDEDQGREVAAREGAVGGQAGHELHRDVGGAVGRPAQLMDRDDLGVAHARQRLELARQRVGRQVPGRDGEALERALGAVGQVAGQEDLAHAAAAERAQQQVAPGETLAHDGPRRAPASCLSSAARTTGSGDGPWLRKASWNARKSKRLPSRRRSSSRISRIRHLPSV